MVFKKNITLLVATKTIPFFVVVPIISDQRCSKLHLDYAIVDTTILDINPIHTGGADRIFLAALS